MSSVFPVTVNILVYIWIAYIFRSEITGARGVWIISLGIQLSPFKRPNQLTLPQRLLILKGRLFLSSQHCSQCWMLTIWEAKPKCIHCCATPHFTDCHWTLNILSKFIHNLYFFCESSVLTFVFYILLLIDW